MLTTTSAAIQDLRRKHSMTSTDKLQTYSTQLQIFLRISFSGGESPVIRPSYHILIAHFTIAFFSCLFLSHLTEHWMDLGSSSAW